ncbi:pirin domain-containing protein [Jimgerdemannia flammicorona]|uniref:Pirin domain-containing protein n=1 Tax=Jimgerdemannia flammicorona TaxID=994334 RepID=A0A433DF58_9FUNG|nr:pirin domain-containing protein [Jimgerdemannia flammicorona]
MGPKITPRRSEDRGHFDLDWLDTYHTFSFDEYYDHNFTGFGALKVINEDLIKPGKGFGKHDHEEFEIFTYMLSGELRHQDSLGNTEILRRGDIQFTTSGSGITHSESNASSRHNCKLLQIWTQPDGDGKRLAPAYQTMGFSDARKLNTFLRVVAPAREGDGDAIAVHADLSVYAGILEPGRGAGVVAKEGLGEDGRRRTKRGYVHVANFGGTGEVVVWGREGEVVLREGDGAFVREWRVGEELGFEARKGRNVEVLVFDLA